MVQKMVEATVLKGTQNIGFIFDGFPRTANQAHWLREMLIKIDSKVHVLLNLEVEEEELKKRLMERGIAAGRDDDKSRSVVETRLKVYHSQTEPVIDYYKQFKKYQRIDGMGSLDDVFERICSSIDSKLASM